MEEKAMTGTVEAFGHIWPERLKATKTAPAVSRGGEGMSGFNAG